MVSAEKSFAKPRLRGCHGYHHMVSGLFSLCNFATSKYFAQIQNGILHPTCQDLCMMRQMAVLPPEATVREAAVLMVQEEQSAVLVVDDRHVVACAGWPKPPGHHASL